MEKWSEADVFEPVILQIASGRFESSTQEELREAVLLKRGSKAQLKWKMSLLRLYVILGKLEVDENYAQSEES